MNMHTPFKSPAEVESNCSGVSLSVESKNSSVVSPSVERITKPATPQNSIHATRLGGHRHAATGFTLIELLVVIGIMALVMSFSGPAMTGIVGGSQISQATDTVIGQLKYGSQVALSQNLPVEVRLYQYQDKNIPGSGPSIRAIQLWQIGADSQARAVNKLQRFTGTIVVSATTGLTNLPTTGTCTSSSADNPSILASLPSGVSSYYYKSFQFRPDGTTSLPATTGTTWHMTVVNENTPGTPTAPPKNFATIQIEPVTGAIRVYRP